MLDTISKDFLPVFSFHNKVPFDCVPLGLRSGRMISFDINRFERKLFPCNNLDADAPAIGAGKIVCIIGFVFFKTGHALEFRGNDAKMQPGTFGNSVLGNDIPIELDRLVHQFGQLAHNNMQVSNAFGVRFLGVFQGNIENRLGNGEFVHGRIIALWYETHWALTRYPRPLKRGYLIQIRSLQMALQPIQNISLFMHFFHQHCPYQITYFPNFFVR